MSTSHEDLSAHRYEHSLVRIYLPHRYEHPKDLPAHSYVFISAEEDKNPRKRPALCPVWSTLYSLTWWCEKWKSALSHSTWLLNGIPEESICKSVIIGVNWRTKRLKKRAMSWQEANEKYEQQVLLHVFLTSLKNGYWPEIPHILHTILCFFKNIWGFEQLNMPVFVKQRGSCNY